MLHNNKMDGLEISRTLETGRALTQQAQMDLEERKDNIRGLLDKRDKDLKEAKDKKDADYNTDWSQGAITGGETAFSFATAKSPFDIQGSLAAELKQGAGDVINRIVGGVSDVVQGDPSKQPLPSRNVIEGPDAGEARRVQARSARVAQAESDELSRVEGLQAPLAPVQPDAPLGQVQSEAERMRDLGSNIDRAAGSQLEVQQRAIDLARQNAPTATKTWSADSSIGNDVVASNPEELQSTKVARNAVIGEQIASKETTLGKLAGKAQQFSDVLNHPVTKTVGKVYGNIQGGEDIYDMFAHKDQFDPKGAGGEAMYASHILDSLGTVSDVIGTFIPGAEEVGALLNIGSDIASDIGKYQKDTANASTITTNASATVNQVNSKPLAITPAFQSAGLVASAARHVANQSSAATF